MSFHYPEMGETHTDAVVRSYRSHDKMTIFWKVDTDSIVAPLLKKAKIRTAKAEVMKAADTVSGKGWFKDGSDVCMLRITIEAWKRLNALGCISHEALLD